MSPTFQRGSIAVAGQDVTLDIETCAKIEGEDETRCFPNRYVVLHGRRKLRPPRSTLASSEQPCRRNDVRTLRGG